MGGEYGECFPQLAAEYGFGLVGDGADLFAQLLSFDIRGWRLDLRLFIQFGGQVVDFGVLVGQNTALRIRILTGLTQCGFQFTTGHPFDVIQRQVSDSAAFSQCGQFLIIFCHQFEQFGFTQMRKRLRF